MKRFLSSIGLLLFALALTACTTCEECDECPEPVECNDCEECEECEVVTQQAFYVEMEFAASGYTPAYTYYLSGTLNELGKITDMHFDMVSSVGTSKRSTDYLMNNATILIGGDSGNQTIDLFIGGSSEHIAQIYNSIKGNLTADGSETFMSIPLLGAYPGAVVNYSEEIYSVFADALGITIDTNTTVAEVLTAAGLFDTTNNLVKNGRKVIELEGYYGGGNYDSQLTALENYAISNQLTLVEFYNLLSGTNQGYDNRDAVAGATVLFDAKMISIAALAAGISIDPNATTIIGTTVENSNTTITVKAKGMADIVASVVINDSGIIIEMTVISHTETDTIGKLVIDGDYIQSIIDGQSNVADIDVVAGASLTSNALKNIAMAALSEFNK
ncbi:MAG: FMN-binding protein [Firmicutes bacterium]|nr:FMN-binding protein [Bacillota bacterium]